MENEWQKEGFGVARPKEGAKMGLRGRLLNEGAFWQLHLYWSEASKKEVRPLGEPFDSTV